MTALNLPGRYQPASVKHSARIRFIRERKRRLLARIPDGIKGMTDAQAGAIQRLIAAEWELAVVEIEQEKHRRIVLAQNELVLKLNREFDRLTTPRPEPVPPPDPIAHLHRHLTRR